MKLSLMIIGLLFVLQVHAGKLCEDNKVMSEKLLTHFCWNCVLPIVISNVELDGSKDDAPDDEEVLDEFVCSCKDENGVPMWGVPTSMWEPVTLVELQRVPGCIQTIAGMELNTGQDSPFGNIGEQERDGGDSTLYNYRYYAFPVLQFIDLYVNRQCSSPYPDVDLMNVSEYMASWYNSIYAFFMAPESAAFANPVTLLACMADSAAANVGKPVKHLFWCAGAWGNVYPLSGHQSTKGALQDTSLLATRTLAIQHRLGLEFKTIGKSTMCGSEYSTLLPKHQYKYSIIYPGSETDSGHVIGETVNTWGSLKMIPGQSSPVYVIWRWNDCCNT